MHGKLEYEVLIKRDAYHVLSTYSNYRPRSSFHVLHELLMRPKKSLPSKLGEFYLFPINLLKLHNVLVSWHIFERRQLCLIRFRDFIMRTKVAERDFEARDPSGRWKRRVVGTAGLKNSNLRHRLRSERRWGVLIRRQMISPGWRHIWHCIRSLMRCLRDLGICGWGRRNHCHGQICIWSSCDAS